MSNSLGCNPNTQSSSSSCQTVCANYNGIWNTATQLCALAQYVSIYCVKLQYNNIWSLDMENGGYGCDLTQANFGNSNYPYGSTAWTTALQYTSINMPNSGSNVTLPAATLIVRHARDPYIEAALVTGGSYNFGLSTGQTLALGLILIIVGCVFLLPAILVTVLCCYCIQNA